MTHTYLLEIGIEEMPANVILSVEKQLKEKVTQFLNDKHLAFEDLSIFSTPRRFAIKIHSLATKQADENLVVRGPARRIAQDEEGNWTKAAIGFSKGQGGSVKDLIFKDENGEEYVYMEKFIPGKEAAELLRELNTVVTAIEFPKNMKWGNYSYQYVRPIHWIVSLLDDQVIPFNVFDVSTSNTSEGHRFLGEQIELNHPDEYEEKLKNEAVIPNRLERKKMIKNQIEAICAENDWLVPTAYEELLDEVTNLVEYPTAFYGKFDEVYLSVPDIVLKTAMIDHQRYFPVQKNAAPYDLLPYFISVRNGNAEHIENVIKGNEKVISPRFADAKFFYEEDQKVPLTDFIEQLKRVEYHAQLGSIYDKQVRAKSMVPVMAQYFNLDATEQENLERVTDIYKFDLMTQVVVEFTTLQGTIGQLYAAERDEPEAVATAIGEQYMPLSGTDALPGSKLGKFIALIDKLDSLIQFFSIGLRPTGSNDPYALRRQAMGVVRMLLELQEKPLEINELIADLANASGVELNEALIDFLEDRLEQIMQTEYKIPHDIRQATLGAKHKNFKLMLSNSLVLNETTKDDHYKDIVEQITRVMNITKDQTNYNEVNAELFETPSEIKLAEATENLDKTFATTYEAADRFEALAAISPIISGFFENNMIMVDDEAVKENRLNLLTKIADNAQAFADFSRLVI